MSQKITVSYSRLDKWINCPKAFEFSYIQEITPKYPRFARHFDLGTYVHELLHVLFHMVQAGYKVDDPFVYDSMLRRIQSDLERFESEGVEFDEDILTVLAKATRVVTNYLTMQAPIIDIGIQVQSVEEVFEVPLELSTGQVVYLNGIIDLSYFLHGNVVRDHKTGKDTRYFTGEKIGANKQLWFYAVAKYLMGVLVKRFEISYCSTHDYKTKPTKDQLFKVFTHEISERSILVYKGWLTQQIERMLESPYYRNLHDGCTNCNFWEICKTELLGFDATPIINGNYVKKEPHGITQQDSPRPSEEVSVFKLDFRGRQ